MPRQGSTVSQRSYQGTVSQRSYLGATSWRSYLGAGMLATAIALSLLALLLLTPLANTHHANAGHDFRILYAAAQLLRLHQNPYDSTLLLPQIISSGLSLVYLVGAQGTLIQPYVYPPIVAWCLIGLTYLAPEQALLTWRLFSAVCVFAGTLGLTAAWNRTNPDRPFGSRLHQLLLAALVTCSPLAAYVYYWGNPVVVVYAAMGGWCWLLTRNHARADTLAGVVMTLALLKPQLALPLAALALWCLVRGDMAAARRWRVARAAALTCVALVGLDLALVGPGLLLDWPRSIEHLSSLIYTQPDMPSLIGLLQPILKSASGPVQYAALYAAMVLGVLAVVWLYRMLRGRWMPMALLAFLTVVWCFATPYSHANDALLMVPAGLALTVALIARLGEPQTAPHVEWTPAAVGALVLSSIPMAISVLALWALWRGGVLYYEPLVALPIRQLPLVPLLLVLALALDGRPLRPRERQLATAPPRGG